MPTEVEDDDIVVGDVLAFNAHSRANIPCDGLMISGADVKVDESSLTGEPEPQAISARARHELGTSSARARHDLGTISARSRRDLGSSDDIRRGAVDDLRHGGHVGVGEDARDCRRRQLGLRPNPRRGEFSSLIN